MIKTVKTTAMLMLLGLLLSACSSTGRNVDIESRPEEAILRATNLIEDKKYEEARDILTEVRARDISGEYAPIAKLKIADSYAKEEEPQQAIEHYEQFLDLYAYHKYASYAQYQLAMLYWEQIQDVERGYWAAIKALEGFRKLKYEYPRTPYRLAADAKIQQCLEIMAEYEFMVGKFYFDRDAFKGAAGRFEPILSEYPDYNNIPGVLFHLSLSYLELDRPDLARKYLGELVEEYPENDYAARARETLRQIGNNGG